MNPDGPGRQRPETFVFTKEELRIRDQLIYDRGVEKGSRATLENLIQVVGLTIRYARHLRGILIHLYPYEGSLPGEQDGQLHKHAVAAGLGVNQLVEKSRKRGLNINARKFMLPLSFRDSHDNE